MKNTIKCPKCKTEIEITDALASEIREETELKLRQKIENETELKLKDKENEIGELRDKNKKRDEELLESRKKIRELKEKEATQELEIQKRIAAEKDKTKTEALKIADEEHRLKDLEKEKQNADLKKQIDEMKRKMEQGSQQTQGEVLELDIEETLRHNFPHDEIKPVEKGIRGADIRQIVKSPMGRNCGVILWESKRTKNWTDSWIPKLKSDLRAEKANTAALISQAMPEEIKSTIGLKDGVWICAYDSIVPLAMLLRKSLLDVGYQKAVQSGSADKAKLLYAYVTSHQFAQQVEVLVEVYREMNDQIIREKTAFEKSWKQREAQIQRLLISTAGMYGSMQGLAGSSMPQIKGLELLEEPEK